MTAPRQRRGCSRIYTDPAISRLIDICDREEHEGDPIHRGRFRDVEWQDETDETGKRRSKWLGGSLVKRAHHVTEPAQPSLFQEAD